MKEVLKYPDGQRFDQKSPALDGHANKGMDLEQMIITSLNEGYQNDQCWIVKYPTPVTVVKTMTRHGVVHITDGFFTTPSCCDFIGVCAGKAIALEAKSTIKKRFAYSLIQPHQLSHLKDMIAHQGKSYVVIEMKAYGEIFLVDGGYIIQSIESNHKSMSIDELRIHGKTIQTDNPYHPLKLSETLYNEVKNDAHRNQ